MNGDTVGYYRMVEVTLDLFTDWLNLPKGFYVDTAQMDYDGRRMSLRVACPRSKRYAVKEYEPIPRITPLAHANRYGFLVKLWHPDLGQKEPSERRRRIKA